MTAQGAGGRATFAEVSARAAGQGFPLTRRPGGGYLLGAGEKLTNLAEVAQRLAELQELTDDAEKFTDAALARAAGTWVHLVLTATDRAGAVDRRRVLESRSDRRAAKKAMFKLAKKHKMLGVIGGLGSEYDAPRAGGGRVLVAIVDCPTGPTCRGECCGPELKGEVRRPARRGADLAAAAGRLK